VSWRTEAGRCSTCGALAAREERDDRSDEGASGGDGEVERVDDGNQRDSDLGDEFTVVQLAIVVRPDVPVVGAA
jgi:hypothetical protein